jgi:hypothetical protein
MADDYFGPITSEELLAAPAKTSKLDGFINGDNGMGFPPLSFTGGASGPAQSGDPQISSVVQMMAPFNVAGQGSRVSSSAESAGSDYTLIALLLAGIVLLAFMRRK